MQVCNLSHTNHPACVVDVCANRREDAEGVRIHADLHAHSRAAENPPWCHEHHHHHHHHHPAGAGGSQMLLGGFTPAQPQEWRAFLSTCQLALLGQAREQSGCWLFPLVGVQGVWERATPHCCSAASRLSLRSSKEAELILLLIQHATAVENIVVANRSDLAGLPWQLCSSI